MRPRGSPRGIIRHERRAGGRQHASMRPRGSPRGIVVEQSALDAMVPASMRPRGSPRGIHAAHRQRPHDVPASMRPRGSPRGIVTGQLADGFRLRASMRPRGSPRGIGPLVTDCGPRCWLPECERSGGCCARAATAAALSRDHSLQLSSCQRVAGVRALPGGATALERSRHGGGRCHTMTGSRRTA